MHITAIRTVRLAEFSNLIHVLVDTDEGLTGLGETFIGVAAVEAYLHETVAPLLVGSDPLRISEHAQRLLPQLGYGSTGVEMRARSAVDIALWDLFGKVTGQPLHQVLGGRVRDRIRTYNTCAGYGYIRHSGQHSTNWGLPEDQAVGPYEDLEAFLERPAELAHSLRDEGITAMKIWPFDLAAEETGGQFITPRQLDRALWPLREIRDAMGDEMDVMLEFHGLWNLPSALRICAAAEELNPYWYEDAIRADDVDALARLASTVSTPLTLSETVGGLTMFRRLLDSGAAGIAMLDIGWVGGLTEARKIAAVAEAHQIPVAPHDCTGPVVLAASTHLSLHLPNALIQESVRAFLTSWYQDLVTALPVSEGGTIRPPEGPGLGLDLLPDLLTRPDATVRTTGLADLGR